MPELPEIETIKRGLDCSIKGKIIDHITLYRPDLRFPFPDYFSTRTHGMILSGFRRRSKYLLIDLKGKQEPLSWLIHFGMSGQIKILDIIQASVFQPAKHDHMVVSFSDGSLLVYHDPRRFGFMDIFPMAEESKHPRLQHLGFEPLSSDFPLEKFTRKLHKRKGRIKQALIDQKLITGIGNIYSLEALWHAGISPFTACNQLDSKKIKYLYQCLYDVLSAAIEAGGSSLRDYRQIDGGLGYFQHQWKVYGREGTVCKRRDCKGIIMRCKDSGRSSFYCSLHQKSL